MSYIITDDKHYKNIAKSLRSKLQTDRKYGPSEMAVAIDNIPSSSDGTDHPVGGIYLLNPDSDGYPTKIKITNFTPIDTNISNPFSTINTSYLKRIQTLEFINSDAITEIKSKDFEYCKNLTTMILPSKLKQISNNAFYDCNSLIEVNLPNTLKVLKMSAFESCFNITTINLPSSMTTVETNAFKGCSSLEHVSIGNNFNCPNVNLSTSTKYLRETIVSWLNALADRTGQTAYTLTIGAKNLAKLTEEDILIATNKNWTLS